MGYTRDRPIGLTLIIGFFALGTIALLLFGVLGLLVGRPDALLGFPAALIYAVLVLGLWRAKKWAYYATLVLQVLGIVVSVLASEPLSLTPSLLIVLYLRWISDHFR